MLAEGSEVTPGRFTVADPVTITCPGPPRMVPAAAPVSMLAHRWHTAGTPLARRSAGDRLCRRLGRLTLATHACPSRSARSPPTPSIFSLTPWLSLPRSVGRCAPPLKCDEPVSDGFSSRPEAALAYWPGGAKARVVEVSAIGDGAQVVIETDHDRSYPYAVCCGRHDSL